MWDMYDASYHDRNKKRRVVDDIANSLELSGKFFRNYSPEGRTFFKVLPAVKQVVSACETVSIAYLLCVHVNGFILKTTILFVSNNQLPEDKGTAGTRV